MLMNVFRNLKAIAAMYVSIAQEVTTASVQMDSKCLKTTRLVIVQKVFRSRPTGQCAWVSSNTKTVVEKRTTALNVHPALKLNWYRCFCRPGRDSRILGSFDSGDATKKSLENSLLVFQNICDMILTRKTQVVLVNFIALPFTLPIERTI